MPSCAISCKIALRCIERTCVKPRLREFVVLPRMSLIIDKLVQSSIVWKSRGDGRLARNNAVITVREIVEERKLDHGTPRENPRHLSAPDAPRRFYAVKVLRV